MSESSFQSSKIFRGFSCSQRQWRHSDRSAYIHGYKKAFHFVFECQELAGAGYVVDNDDLQELQEYLEDTFSHTLLLNKDDPLLENFKQLSILGACDLQVLPYGVSMEGTSKHLCEYADKLIREKTKGRCWVISVETKEDNKNSSVYFNPVKGYRNPEWYNLYGKS